MTKQKAIIVDLDGTLANIDHRLHFVKGDKKDFDKFYEAIPNDSVNKWCRKIIYRFDNDYKIIYVTGRMDSGSVMVPTVDWLTRNGVYYGNLFMRKNGDHRPDSTIKKEIYEKYIKDKYDVLFCIDDRARVVNMWRELGLVCLQCAKGDF